MAIRRGLKIAAGAVLLAVVMWGVLAMPGFLTEVDSGVQWQWSRNCMSDRLCSKWV